MVGIMLGLNLAISLITFFVGHDLPTMWTMMNVEAVVSFLLVTTFTAVIAAASVADEFTAGTIKLLLIRPWSRSKILLSKYISVLLFGLFLVVVLYVFTYVLNLVLFGYSSAPASEEFSPLISGSAASFMLKYYVLKFIPLVITATLAFMLSTVFRSGGLAIGLSLFLILGVNTVMKLVAMLDYKWIDYLIFVHLDLVQYLVQSPLREGMTMGFSLINLAVYYVIFLVITWYVFNKRDVAA